MNESGWATTGDNAKRVDSGAGLLCRIDPVNDSIHQRSCERFAAVGRGLERACSPWLSGGGSSPNGRLWRHRRGLTGDGDRAGAIIGRGRVVSPAILASPSGVVRGPAAADQR